MTMAQYRTGLGYDIHRTAAGRRLVLAGVQVPCEFGLLGHSDADIVLHALCDALLGAIAAGDIGELFPDSDPAYKNADSRQFVQEALRRVHAAGYRVVNADVVLLAERPRIAPHKDDMRRSLAGLLDVSTSAVGVKATTNEGVGEIGRGEAMACWTTVLLEREG